MGKYLIRNGHVINPATNTDRPLDLLVEDGQVVAWFLPGAQEISGAEDVDVLGLHVVPGLIDIHVHLREPGGEHKETIETGCRAALKGGFTTVVCMPNTTPRLSTPELVQQVTDKAREVTKVRVLTAAAMINESDEITDYAALAKVGAVCVSDDAFPIQKAHLMWEGMKLAGQTGLPVMTHCEDFGLTDGGIVNEGQVSRDLGVKGMARCAEDVQVTRNITLARSAGAHLHIQHISTAQSVEWVRMARQAGYSVTAEACPHHLLYTEEELRERDPNFRMNPPLRTEIDRLAVWQAVLDGTITVIGSDHAPHTPEEKADFDTAPFGIIGLEVSFPLVWHHFQGQLSPLKIVDLFTWGPAQALNLKGGNIATGQPADMTFLDLHEKWTITEDDFGSKSKNTPYIGREVTGRVKKVMIGGEMVG